MKFSILTLLPAILLASNTFATRVTSHHAPSRRDNRTTCTQEMVSDFWAYSKPPHASAVVCYRSDSDRVIRDTSADHYKYIASRYCTEFSFLQDSDVERLCFDVNSRDRSLSDTDSSYGTAGLWFIYDFIVFPLGLFSGTTISIVIKKPTLLNIAEREQFPSHLGSCQGNVFVYPETKGALYEANGETRSAQQAGCLLMKPTHAHCQSFKMPISSTPPETTQCRCMKVQPTIPVKCKIPLMQSK
ncbi:potential glycerophosphoinositol permease [Pseudozyma hubeiensis SY62]|uniref:Potential glycerophosphoinositol permease n=1 Tax=Pseudozyma hubeiensis (strain SY62) TaxID=1305764 RepID=R9P5P1_PSEHS|nr:potential glycerophosphoinositol permease [Pseudozyma hubeiensis SY62]GAC93405.1 potential glycerophosphoinositol permease [Pseudozyma hubeiensis SY62]